MMVVSKDKINNYFLQIIFFLGFLGFYVVLLLMFNAGKGDLSRQLTIPMRAVIGGSSILLFVFNLKNEPPHLKWFYYFVLIYLIRVFIDYNLNKFFYISYKELFFYFSSFVIIPFIGLSKIDYNKVNIKKIYLIFLISALLFSSLSIILYGKYIGQVNRLSTGTTGEETISPLILSYCGTLIIGVVSSYLLFGKNKSKLIKGLSLIVIILAIIPFFLGASRGSIFAIFFPFIIMALTSISISNILKYSILFIFIVISLIYLDEYLDSGLLNRFMGTSEAIETGGSSAGRLGMWKISIYQFIDFPYLGDKLNTNNINFYPHNIFLEVLQTTGVIGAVPFFVLTFKALIASYKIFKYHKQLSWVPVIFLQSIMKHMFSGALYTASWFWISMAVVLSLSFYLNKKEYENNNI